MGERVGKREKDRSNEGSNNNDCRTEYGQMLNTTALFLSRSLFISPACDRFAHFTYGNNAIFAPKNFLPKLEKWIPFQVPVSDCRAHIVCVCVIMRSSTFHQILSSVHSIYFYMRAIVLFFFIH